MTTSKALALLSLFMPTKVGYIEDPRYEGTETAGALRLEYPRQRYIEDPRNEGTETRCKLRVKTDEVTLH